MQFKVHSVQNQLEIYNFVLGTLSELGKIVLRSVFFN